jgi:hypothetical protein
MFSLVHAQAASTAAEAVALRSELSSVTVLAEEHAFVLGAVCGVEELAAQVCQPTLLLYSVHSHFIRN